MDHSYGRSRPFGPPPPEMIAVGARVVSFLHGGGRMVVLAGTGGSAILDLVLEGMPGRVLRVRNALPGPMDLGAVLAQIGADATGRATGRDGGAALVGCLMERAHDSGPAVLAIDGAQTLTREALLALAKVPGLGGPDLPGAILLLAGDAGVPARLRGAGLERLRDPRSALAVSFPADMEAQSAPDLLPEPKRRGWAWLGGGVAAAAVLALAVSFWPGQPEQPAVVAPVPPPAPAAVEAEAPIAPPVAAPAQPAPEAAVVDAPPAVEAVVPDAPAAVPAPPEPASARDAQLRQEFDTFLNRAGQDTAQLTPAGREQLFRQYLGWRERTAPKGGQVR